MVISGLIQLLRHFRCTVSKKTKTGTQALSYCVMSLKTRAFATVTYSTILCFHYDNSFPLVFETENDGENNFYIPSSKLTWHKILITPWFQKA